MPIDVQCSSCGKRLRAPDEQAGRKGRCPACKAELQIPSGVAQVNIPTPVPNVNTPTPVPKGYAPMSGARMNAPTPVPKPTAGFASTPGVPPPIPERRGPIEARGSAGTRTDIPPIAEAEGTLEAKHWFALGTALQVTKYALLLSWISLGLLGLALIGTTLASKSTGGDMIISQAIAFLELWGKAGTFLGWTILFSGWLMCLSVWPAVECRWLRISAGVTVLLIVILLILLTLPVVGIGEDSNSIKAAITKTVPMIVFGLAAAASLIAFGYFLAGLEVRMGNDRRPREPLIRAVIISVLMIWCIVANLFFEPSAPWKAWMIVISNLVAFFTPLLWLWLLNVHVSGHLRVSQAWKRL